MSEARFDRRWLTPIAVATAAMLILMLGMASKAHAYSLGYKQFCWGQVLTYKNQGCDQLSHGGDVGYVAEVSGSGAQHSVCVTTRPNSQPIMCSAGPNQGVYNNKVNPGLLAYGWIQNNASGNNTVYGASVFVKPPAEPPPPPPPTPEGRWFLRNSNTTGIADVSFLYGGPELIPVTGDWNNDGIDTPGAYKPTTGEWFLRNSNTEGVGEINFTYGGCCDLLPVVGDWNKDGIDTVGLYKPTTGEWYLRNSNTSGVGEINFIYGGGSTTKPLAGDWNNDGTDTIGIVNITGGVDEWYLRNSNTAGGGEINFTYGSGTELKPVVGDWNNDGIDTAGLYKPSAAEWYLRNTNATGGGEILFVYGGGSQSWPIAGDWNGDGTDTIGIRN